MSKEADWGRVVLASLFTAGTLTSIVANQQAWSRILSGHHHALDWLDAALVLAALVSGVLFALGRVAIPIASGWSAFCILHACTAYPFWTESGPALADDMTGFLSQLAVAASLMLLASRTAVRT